jgi:flavin reductase (DIM6/NTAB) family NADH-FMN oxidoreductase RutF
LPTDKREIRKAFGSYATGVTIITTRVAGQLYGLTANSFTSVSLSPPILLFCIGRSRNSFEAFRSTLSFTINVLSSSQRELSERFAASGEDKWVGVDFLDDEMGNAIFPGAAAAFTCSKSQTIDAADHMIVLGEVLNFRQSQDRLPLVYCRSRYCLPIDMVACSSSADNRTAC